jgi:hypothetical protein
VIFVDSLDGNSLVGLFAVPVGRTVFRYTLSDPEYRQLVGVTALEYGNTLSIFDWSCALYRTLADIDPAGSALPCSGSGQLAAEVRVERRAVQRDVLCGHFGAAVVRGGSRRLRGHRERPTQPVHEGAATVWRARRAGHERGVARYRAIVPWRDGPDPGLPLGRDRP